MAILSFDWMFAAQTVEPPTGSQLRLDDADMAAATKIWARNITVAGADVWQVLMAVPLDSKLVLQDFDDHTRSVTYLSSGPPVDKGSYVELPVVHVSDTGVALAAQKVTLYIVTPTDEPGPPAPIAPAGMLCTVAEVVAELKLSDKQPDLKAIERQIQAASQAIVEFGKREFYAAPANPELRPFAGASPLSIGDAAEVVAVTDAASGDEVGFTAPVGRHGTIEQLLLASVPAAVDVEARFGFPAVLPDVHEAAIKQSASWYVQDSSRLAQSFVLSTAPQVASTAPKSLLYAVRELVRPYRYVSLA